MNARVDSLTERRAAFSERLRHLLHQRGWSMDPSGLAVDFTLQSARPMGASAQTFSNWLNGMQLPRAGNMQALAKWLNVTTELLTNGLPVLQFAPMKHADIDTDQLVLHFQQLDAYGRKVALAQISCLARLARGAA